MAYVLRFEATTNANYTSEELEAVRDDFSDFITTFDGDVTDVEDVVIREDNAKTPAISDEQKQEIIQEFLKGSDLRVKIEMVNDDGESVFSAKLES